MENPAFEEKLRLLSKLNFPRFLFSLGLDWLGILATLGLYSLAPNLFSFLLASISIGLFQHAIAILGHEAVHFRICKDRGWNDRLGNLLCFFPTSLTVSSYRDFHFPHHRDPFGTQDPEIILRKSLGPNFAPPFTLSRGLRLWLWSFLGFSLRELVVFVSLMPRGKISEKLCMAALWICVLVLCHHFQRLDLAGLWIFSLCTTYFSTIRIQGWYEHGLSDMNTNRYQIPSQFFRILVPHNIWVHYEHHKYPEIPFYHLEKARSLDQSTRIYTYPQMVEKLGQDWSSTFHDTKKSAA